MHLMHNRDTRASYQTKYSFAWVVFISLLYFSCTRSYQNNIDHPDEFNPVLKYVDTIQFNKKKQALNYLDSFYRNFPKPGAGDTYSYDSIKSDQLSFAMHDYIKALAYADSMLLVTGSRVDNEINAQRYSFALYQKGDCFRHLKQYDEALHYYQLARQIVYSYVKNKCNIARYDGSIALLMFVQEKYQLAASYFINQSQDFRNNCLVPDYRHMLDLAASLNNAALSYIKAGMYDSAWYYENAGLEVIAKDEKRFLEKISNTEYAKAVIYGDQAEVLTHRGKYADAEELYKKAIKNSHDADLPYSQFIKTRLADLYLGQGDKKSAEGMLTDLKQYLDSVTDESLMKNLLKLKVKYFVQQRQTDSAFANQQQLDNLKDSVESRDKKFAAEDVVKSFENQELKFAAEALEKAGKLKSLYLTVVALVSIIIAIIAVFVWQNFRRERKTNIQIQQKSLELQKSYASLEQSHQENSRILKIVAHDLKNPISAIKNLTHTLLKKNPEEEQKKSLEIINDSCTSSLSLINDLLYEKKNAGNEKTIVDVKDLLENCVELLQIKASEKNQRIHLEAENISALLDDEKMWRVISNIVSNAIKFSYRDSQIDIRLTKKDSSALLEVSDKGIGIPTKIAEKIFTMSEDSRRYGTAGEKSHGLGLSISKKIIEEHGGKIWFESAAGKGTVFYVELPCVN